MSDLLPAFAGQEFTGDASGLGDLLVPLCSGCAQGFEQLAVIYGEAQERLHYSTRALVELGEYVTPLGCAWGIDRAAAARSLDNREFDATSIRP